MGVIDSGTGQKSFLRKYGQIVLGGMETIVKNH